MPPLPFEPEEPSPSSVLLLEKILFSPVQEVYKYADRARIGSDILMSWNS